MKLNKFMRIAIAASAIAVLIAAVSTDERVLQPVGASGIGLPFLHAQSSTQMRVEGNLPSFGGGTEWLNSPPLSAAALRGKVVVVQFWTYTCINWLRTLAYVRAWADKYKKDGLVVIGVHSPEFDFERNVDNVRRAVKSMRIDYPVVVDSKHAIWSAFNNAYWPALYFVDAKGRVRHHHFGEGEYDQSEMIIRQLLVEAGATNLTRDSVPIVAEGLEAAADWPSLGSPENYLGYQRTDNFASPGGIGTDKRRTYAAPPRLTVNHWALTGDWTVQKNAAALNAPNGRIVYRFHARDVHVVMGPAARGQSVRFRVLIDGQPPRDDHGIDVDAEGNGTVSEQRLYQLIRQRKPVVDRQVDIEFLDPGVEAYAFTFG